MNRTAPSKPEQTGRVRVYIRPQSDDLRELADEITTICAETVRAFREFYTPGSLSAGFCRVEDPEVTEATFSGRENVATHSFPIESSDSPALENAFRDFATEQNTNTANHVYLSDFEFDGSVVRIYLPVGDVETAEDSPRRYRSFEPGGDAPTTHDNPPFYIQFAHFPGTHVKSADPTPTHVYALLLYLNAEVYFEDSRIGEINRARVREGISRIRDEFDVIECTAAPALLHETQFGSELLRSDGPSSEQLLRGYRREWVESELVETATQYDEAGETIFEVTSDAPEVQIAELRKRAEAYVDDQREQGNAPQADLLRIVRTDGNQLEARLTDDGLEWVDEVTADE